MATCDSITLARLAEAQTAYHELLTGQMARVIVDLDGKRVEFTAANKGALYSYILQLQALCPRAPGVTAANYGPARFIF